MSETFHHIWLTIENISITGDDDIDILSHYFRKWESNHLVFLNYDISLYFHDTIADGFSTVEIPLPLAAVTEVSNSTFFEREETVSGNKTYAMGMAVISDNSLKLRTFPFRPNNIYHMKGQIFCEI